MPAYVVRSLNVPATNGNVTWFCVINTSTGNEVCRSTQEIDADRICGLLIASEM